MAVNPAASGGTPQITGAIRQAAQSTGISFDYLLTTAKIESNFNPSAQASTSSAKGLYQFIDQTWLGTMKQDGAALGLGRYAGAIARSADGHYDVSDPAMRAAILRLRSDPQVSAMLAGALTRNNAALVSSNIGRQPSSGELYIAHFLGADGAGRLINGAAKQPHARAAAMFPHAAAANHSIFYDASGRARSVGEVYGKLTRLFDSARTVAFAQSGVTDVAGASVSTLAPPLPAPVTVAAARVKAVPNDRPVQVASAAPPKPPAPIPSPPTPPARISPPDTAGMTQAFVSANEKLPPPPPARPSFQSMFTDRVNQPLAQTVNNLWGATANGTPAPPVQSFDLFTDVRPNERKLLGGKA
ncbi:MAG: transglycosylase SLT domain-containing protein [Pseudolabrys sp.]